MSCLRGFACIVLYVLCACGVPPQRMLRGVVCGAGAMGRVWRVRRRRHPCRARFSLVYVSCYFSPKAASDGVAWRLSAYRWSTVSNCRKSCVLRCVRLDMQLCIVRACMCGRRLPASSEGRPPCDSTRDV